MTRDRQARPRALVRVAMTAAAAVVAGLCFDGAFERVDLLRPLAVAAAGASTLSLVATTILRTRLALAVVVLGLGAVPLGIVAGIGAGDLLTGFRDGPHQILTATAPAPADPVLLAVPFLVVLAAAGLGAELAQRAASPLLPALPSLVASAAALAFGAGGVGPGRGLTVTWVLLAAGLLATARGRRPSETSGAVSTRSRRHALLAVPVALVAVGLALPLAERLPGSGDRDRFELRDLVAEPAVSAEVGNPLAAVTGLQGRHATDVQLTVEASGRIDRLRVAVLDRYDGVEWTSRTQFLPAGTELPGADGRPVEGTRVTQSVELDALAGAHLPAADRPVAIDREGQRFDPASGVLIRGDEPLRSYTVESVLPEVDVAALVHAGAAADADAVAAREVPADLPVELSDLARQVAGPGSAYAQASALERFLAAPGHDGFTLVTEDPPSGHTLGHLRCFLLSPDRCSKQGSTEQFVAAYALLARSIGIPARVVVGFDAPNVAVGERGAVTGADATAWAEVKLDGIGWVPVDPVPDPGVVLAPPPEDVAGDDAQDQEDPVPADDGGAGAEDEGGDRDRDRTTSGGRRATDPRLVAAGVLGAAAVLLAVPGIVRWRRRERRRRAPSTTLQVAGAWDEALDELVAAGVQPTVGSAVLDVAAAGRARLGDPAAALPPLGTLVNQALFDRDEPSLEEVVAAWRLVDRFQAERRRSTSSWQRVREYLALRRPGRRGRR